MKRSDIYSPSSIIPADYQFLFGYAHPSSAEGMVVPGFNMDKLTAVRNGDPVGFAAIHKGGACDVCGAWHIEGSVFLHQPTGEAIALGWTCAEKLDLDYDESERARLSGDRKAARASVIKRAKKRAHLKGFVRLATAEVLRALKLDHYITRSIRAQVLRGRDLSDKQIALVLKLAEDAQERTEEARVAAPSREERMVVEGEVVGLKVHETAYGTSLKMTVKVTEANGVWLCWGTVPSDLPGNLRGCIVRFTARLKLSDTDESFAFFKRPSKASIVRLGGAALEDLDKLKADVAEIPLDEQGCQWFKDLEAKVAALETLR